MRVRLTAADPGACSAKEQSYLAPAQTFLTHARDYEVHAVSVYDGVAFILIIDDLNTPVFRPRFGFETVDMSTPDDWICTVLPSGPVSLLMGPEFIAKSVESYGDMLDQRMDQVEAFWRRHAARQTRAAT